MKATERQRAKTRRIISRFAAGRWKAALLLRSFVASSLSLSLSFSFLPRGGELKRETSRAWNVNAASVKSRFLARPRAASNIAISPREKSRHPRLPLN